MAMSLSFTDGSLKESVINQIAVINPDETQLLYGLQRSKALQPVHQWLKQDLTTLNITNAQIEGSAAGAATTTDPVRLTNYCQIFRKVWQVSETQKAGAHYSKDPEARAMDEAMQVIGNEVEFAILRNGAAVAGNSGTARQLQGIKQWIQTNRTLGAAASFTETVFLNLLQGPWAQGGKVDSVYVGPTLKLRIDSFTAGATKQVNLGESDKRLTNVVSYYESSFGTVKIHLHRFVTYSGDTNNDIVGLDTSKWAVAIYRDIKNIDLAKTGSYDWGMFEGEVTVESRNEKSSFIGVNYT